MVKFTISNKSLIRHPKFRMVRKWNKINWDQVNYQLNDDTRIQSAATSTDVNIICDSLIAAITETIDRQEPSRIIQIYDKIPEFVSKETKMTIEKCDKAMKIAKTTKNKDNIRAFKSLRNQVHKMLRRDKQDAIKTTFDEIEGKAKLQWKTTKSHAGWTKQLSPDLISKGGITIKDPKGIADAINLAQISRNIGLHRDVSKTTTDHKTNYMKLVKKQKPEFYTKNSKHE